MIYEGFNVGLKKKLYADSYGKIENGVFYMVGELNSSPNSAIGNYEGVILELPEIEFDQYSKNYEELELAEFNAPDPLKINLFATGIASLEKFMNDFGIVAEIHENKIVSQTI